MTLRELTVEKRHGERRIFRMGTLPLGMHQFPNGKECFSTVRGPLFGEQFGDPPVSYNSNAVPSEVMSYLPI